MKNYIVWCNVFISPSDISASCVSISRVARNLCNCNEVTGGGGWWDDVTITAVAWDLGPSSVQGQSIIIMMRDCSYPG